MTRGKGYIDDPIMCLARQGAALIRRMCRALGAFDNSLIHICCTDSKHFLSTQANFYKDSTAQLTPLDMENLVSTLTR